MTSPPFSSITLCATYPAIAHPNSEVRNDDTFGVLKVTLRNGSYDWEFLPEAGNFTTSAAVSAISSPPGVGDDRRRFAIA